MFLCLIENCIFFDFVLRRITRRPKERTLPVNLTQALTSWSCWPTWFCRRSNSSPWLPRRCPSWTWVWSMRRSEPRSRRSSLSSLNWSPWFCLLRRCSSVRLPKRNRLMRVPRDHLLWDRSPNIGPLISRWELENFKNCWNQRFKTPKILTLLYQQFSNLLISQWDISGPRLGALSNNRWSGVLLLYIPPNHFISSQLPKSVIVWFSN